MKKLIALLALMSGTGALAYTHTIHNKTGGTIAVALKIENRSGQKHYLDLEIEPGKSGEGDVHRTFLLKSIRVFGKTGPVAGLNTYRPVAATEQGPQWNVSHENGKLKIEKVE